MSRVLRRPMFRGGIANSEGVGITSGLENPRQGYADGPTDEGVQQDEYSPLVQDILGFKDFLKLKGATAVDTLFNVPVNKASEYITGYNPGLSAVRQMQQKGDPLFAKYDPDKAYFFNTPTGARKGTIKENIEYQKEKAKTNAAKINLYTEPKEDVTQKYTLPTLEQDIDSYSKLLLDRSGPDKDEYTRQKYLTLAKFGLNLLKPTPAGVPSNLLSSVASAAEKPLEEYGNISMQESREGKALKQLAAQLAFQKHMPGNMAKGVQDLMAVNPKMTVEEAVNIVTTGKNKASLDKEERLAIDATRSRLETNPNLKGLIEKDPATLSLLAKIVEKGNVDDTQIKGSISKYNFPTENSYYTDVPNPRTNQKEVAHYYKGKFHFKGEPNFIVKNTGI
jgi:hypothetical protein